MKAVSTISAVSIAMLLSYSGQSIAAVDKRWFEVEVILFSQLGDKSKLLENFQGDAELPRYRTVIDLLTPYLQPDSTSLRLQLPECNTGNYRESLASQAKLPQLHKEKSLVEIEEAYLNEESGNISNVSGPLAADTSATLLYPNEGGIEEANSANDKTTVNGMVNDAIQPPNEGENKPLASSEIDLSALDAEQSSAEIEIEDELVGLTEKELTFISQAEQTFKEEPLSFDYQYSVTSRDALCQKVSISDTSTINDYLAAANVNYSNSFPIDSFTGRVDGNEFIYTDEPYLIDADSLKLKDITLQLRRSKNFKPLLHLGWRQPLTNRKKPTREPAIRLFSGKHYQQEYRTSQQTFAYQSALDALNQVLSDNNDDASHIADNNESSIASVESSEMLSMLVDTLESKAITLEQTIEELDSPRLYEQVVSENEITLTPPIAPNQDWFLDGYFKLHLNHYLFITADFNIAVPNNKANKQLNEKNVPFKLIPFKQNKRVISKEIHYFDHPYMGMVVQIRRYKKPEPELEITTEEITENNNG
ncbi:hypothetical protein HII17_18260 [Thalassotalea sp. M1531]|uniref:Peptidoglycan-binding protein CsiV n=1 Tax=Thalassotalea algicola TaxID=2716224 RepID=A0A7Y0LFD7_9GAMM|nr:CsiV family protein [Thalassotalea algicola]NMP33495.1 hypothetical protein [Thalassotalea algicola]